jgi:hypothetical protein
MTTTAHLCARGRGHYHDTCENDGETSSCHQRTS